MFNTTREQKLGNIPSSTNEDAPYMSQINNILGQNHQQQAKGALKERHSCLLAHS